MALMVSVSGIRGIYGEDLHPENLVPFTAAFGTWAKKGKVVVGRDSRVTGPLVESIVIATLRSVGCDVISVGIAPTPTVAMSVLEHKAAGAIMISASHNPAQWNALKMLNEKSEYLDSEQGKEVIKITQEKSYSFVDYKSMGSILVDENAVQKHIDAILALPYIDADLIRSKKFRVAVDAVNGAGSESIPALLVALGVAHIEKLYCTPDGLFPHNPEPLPEHLKDICELVPKATCDIGVVVDPDADRLALVDNNGRFFGEEYTLAAINDFYLAKYHGDIAVNLSSSMINDWVAKKYGIVCHRAAVGEINVVKVMQAKNVVMGGEGNGGVINPDLHFGRDGLVGIAMMLQFMAESGKTSAQIRDDLPTYYMGKFKLELGSVNADEALEQVKKAYAQYEINLVDGVKIVMPDGWIHLRKSNTEPIIRIYTEADSQEKANKLAQHVMSLMK
ncbi:phosphoglucosamine mutase [bacterium]|nr:MAG: phosphoglucosamine mutase [bacterium]